MPNIVTTKNARNPRDPRFAGRRVRGYRHRQMGLWYPHPALRDGYFNQRDVPAMLQDNAVNIGVLASMGPLIGAQHEVRANSKEIKTFVEQTIYRFWHHDMPKMWFHYFTTGTSIAETMYEIDLDSGLWKYAGMDDFHQRDVMPLVRGRHLTRMKVAGGSVPLAGEIASALQAGEEPDGLEYNMVEHPKIFWCGRHAVCGELFGRSAFIPSWNPWMEKCGVHGAISIRKLWAFSCAFRGALVKFPEGSTERADGSSVANQDIARELAESYATGAACFCPSEVNEAGQPLWEIIDPKINGEVSALLDYPTNLDKAIWQGMDILNEVISAPDTGGSWSGRSGPLLIFLNGCDATVRELTTAFDVGPSGYVTRNEQAGGVVRPLVMENFGPKAKYEIRTISLVPKPQEPGAGGSPASAPGAAAGAPPAGGLPPEPKPPQPQGAPMPPAAPMGGQGPGPQAMGPPRQAVGKRPLQLSGAEVLEVEIPDDEVEIALSGLFDEQLVQRLPKGEHGGQFTFKHIPGAAIKAAKRAMAAGKLSVVKSETPIVSDASGAEIRHHVTLEDGQKIHPDELHRLKVEDGESVLGPEELDIHEPSGVTTARTLGRALHRVSAFTGKPHEPVTLISAHGYSATRPRSEWMAMHKGGDQKEPQEDGDHTYWRIHDTHGTPLSNDWQSEIADSGENEEATSAAESLPKLLLWAASVGYAPLGKVEVIAFRGKHIGTGSDNEPLVKPIREIARYRQDNMRKWSQLDNETERMSQDEIIEHMQKHGWKPAEIEPVEGVPQSVHDPEQSFSEWYDAEGHVHTGRHVEHAGGATAASAEETESFFQPHGAGQGRLGFEPRRELVARPAPVELSAAPAEDGCRELAEFYAGWWNDAKLAPEDLGERELATVHAELTGGDAVLNWNGAEWTVDGESVGTVSLSTHHAPKGGITIEGKHFRGGQFIPNEVYEDATPAEKEAIDHPAEVAAEVRRSRGSVDVAGLRKRLEPQEGSGKSEIDKEKLEEVTDGMDVPPQSEDGFLYNFTHKDNLPGIIRDGLQPRGEISPGVYGSRKSSPGMAEKLFEETDGLVLMRFKEKEKVWRDDPEFPDTDFVKSDKAISPDDIEVKTTFGWKNLDYFVGKSTNYAEPDDVSDLADAATLTDKQAAAGAKLLAKYHRQLPEELHKLAAMALSAFEESKHPRGQPGNAGEFGPGGAGAQPATQSEPAEQRAPSGWGSIEPAATYPEPKSELTDTQLTVALKRQPLKMPINEGIDKNLVAPAWNMVSRLWPEMAKNISKISEYDPKTVPQGITPPNAFIDPHTGALAIKPGVSLSPETLWHEMVHVEQALRGAIKSSRMEMDAEDYNEVESEAVQRAKSARKLFDRFEKMSKAPAAPAHVLSAWDATEHPRGQPGNAGQFGPAGTPAQAAHARNQEQQRRKHPQLEALPATVEAWQEQGQEVHDYLAAGRAPEVLDKIEGATAYAKAQGTRLKDKMVARYGARNAALILGAGQVITWGVTVGAPILTGLPIIVPPGGGIGTSLALAGLFEAYKAVSALGTVKLSAAAALGDDLLTRHGPRNAERILAAGREILVYRQLAAGLELSAFDAAKHPRGDEKNPGHFAKKGTGKTAAGGQTGAELPNTQYIHKAIAEGRVGSVKRLHQYAASQRLTTMDEQRALREMGAREGLDFSSEGGFAEKFHRLLAAMHARGGIESEEARTARIQHDNDIAPFPAEGTPPAGEEAAAPAAELREKQTERDAPPDMRPVRKRLTPHARQLLAGVFTPEEIDDLEARGRDSPAWRSRGGWLDDPAWRESEGDDADRELYNLHPKPPWKWDGKIDEANIAPRHARDRRITTWDYYDEEGHSFPQDVELVRADYDPDPDNPAAELMDVYRWESRENGNLIDKGEWTADKDEAIADGEDFAQTSHQEKPETEEEDEEQPDEDEDEDSDGDEDEELTPKREYPSKAKVKIGSSSFSKVKGKWDRLFGYRPFYRGEGLTIAAAASLVGAPDDAEVKVDVDVNGDIEINVDHDDFECTRTIQTNGDGETYIHNDSFLLKDRNQAGGGIGTKVIKDQIDFASEHGVAYLETHAAGHYMHDRYNGYYTWPRMGYDMDVGDLDSKLYDKVQETFPDAESVQDIFDMEDVTDDLPEDEIEEIREKLGALDKKMGRRAKDRDTISGREWWQVHGGAMGTARFDLTPGSRSMKAKKDYLG